MPDPRPSRDSLGMMQQPTYWDRWPLLPLKRFKNGRLEVGLLVEFGMAENGEEPDLRFVDGGNLFNTSEAQMAAAVRVDPRKLVSDGWVVD